MKIPLFETVVLHFETRDGCRGQEILSLPEAPKEWRLALRPTDTERDQDPKHPPLEKWRLYDRITQRGEEGIIHAYYLERPAGMVGRTPDGRYFVPGQIR